MAFSAIRPQQSSHLDVDLVLFRLLVMRLFDVFFLLHRRRIPLLRIVLGMLRLLRVMMCRRMGNRGNRHRSPFPVASRNDGPASLNMALRTVVKRAVTVFEHLGKRPPTV